MKIIVRAANEDTFFRLLTRIKGKGFRVNRENRKFWTINCEIPVASGAVLYELLELNGIIERDVRNDLD